jgi:hypothetical protein
MVEVKSKGVPSQASTAKQENDAKVMNQSRRRFDKVRFNRHRLKNHKSIIVTSTCSFSGDNGVCTNKRTGDHSTEFARSISTPDMRSDVEGQNECIVMNESLDGVLGTFEKPPQSSAPEDDPWTNKAKSFVEKVMYGIPSSVAADDTVSIDDASDNSSFPSLCMASPIGRSSSTLDANTVSSDCSFTTTDSLIMPGPTPHLQFTPTPLLEWNETYADEDEQEQELLPQPQTEGGKITSDENAIGSLEGLSSRHKSLVLCYERAREMTVSSLKLRGGGGGDNKDIPAFFQCESSTTCSQLTHNSNADSSRGVPAPTAVIVKPNNTRGTKRFSRPMPSMIHRNNPSNPIDFSSTPLDPVLAIGSGARSPSSGSDEDEGEQTDSSADSQKLTSLDETTAINRSSTSKTGTSILERLKDELMGTLDDTRNAFDDIMHAFSLRSSDIKSVWKRIDKAKDEMDRSLHGRNNKNTAPTGVPSSVDVVMTTSRV